MRKILVGALAGLTLIGGQALAAGASQPLKVGDRLGATSGPSSEFLERVPVVVWVAGIAVVTWVVVEANDDDDSRSN